MSEQNKVDVVAEESGKSGPWETRSSIFAMRRIFPPLTLDDSWKSIANWDDFCKAAHKSIGRDLGGGVVTFSEE